MSQTMTAPGTSDYNLPGVGNLRPKGWIQLPVCLDPVPEAWGSPLQHWGTDDSALALQSSHKLPGGPALAPHSDQSYASWVQI